MIDVEATIERLADETISQFTAQPLPAQVVQPVDSVCDTFKALIDSKEFQAAAGVAGRAIVTAAELVDDTDSENGQTLDIIQRDLVAMLQHVSESQATDPDPENAAELEFLEEALRSSISIHGGQTDRRAEFFKTITSELGSRELSPMAQGVVLCP